MKKVAENRPENIFTLFLEGKPLKFVKVFFAKNIKVLFIVWK
jgi:hypothetical protein